MPITKQAMKKMRSDRVRTDKNKIIKEHIRKALKLARTSPTQKHISAVFTALDKAVKSRVVHHNTASRLKSRLSKLLKK